MDMARQAVKLLNATFDRGDVEQTAADAEFTEVERFDCREGGETIVYQRDDVTVWGWINTGDADGFTLVDGEE